MSLLEAALSMVVPHSCVGCGNEGSIMCDACLSLELPAVPSRCYRCYKSTEQSRTCPSCYRKTSIKHVWFSTLYEGLASKLVLRYKFEFAKAAHKPIGAALARVLPCLPDDTLVVGVPTATGRVRMRGFDHANLLVRQVAAQTGLQYISPVVRIGQMHQVGADRKQRLNQLKDAFVVTNAKSITGKKILLVDDVLTTGTTLERVAKALKTAGAKQIDAVVFAQKM